MDRYYTAELELVIFDEDVITASVATNSTNSTEPVCWFCDDNGLTLIYGEHGEVTANYSVGTEEYDHYCG